MSEPLAASSSDPAAEEDVQVHTPVALMRHDDGKVSLTLGPVTIEELALTLQEMGTEEGMAGFVATMTGALREDIATAMTEEGQ